MVFKARITKKVWMAVLALPLASLMAACQPEINHRGYYAKPGAINQVSNGMSKTEVESILGSPSTTASINFQGDSYYYITSITRDRGFLDPVETGRQVIAVRFDKQDAVSGLAQYGLQDGRVININTRKTPIVGSEFSLLAELLKTSPSVSADPGIGSMVTRSRN
jgi:outer membrane protein assembly factor BamE (lipoprotein component of BamABCDE complex)